jgi:integrase
LHMASIRPYPYKKGYWRAQVRRLGVIDSQVFPSKSEASAWAALREAEITGGKRGTIPNLTVAALFQRYAREVSRGKTGERWEVIRLTALERDRIAAVRLKVLDSPHVSDWQQRRLQAISAASVRRERNLLNNVFEIARKEWRWLKKNPFEGVRRPKDGKARDRIATQEELDKLLAIASPAMQRAIVGAVETGMRAGELASNPEIRGRVAYLLDTKNGTAREVPLSEKAVECFPVGLSAGSISALFAQLCERAGVEGLTYHDLRRTAIVRLAQKLTPMELAKMVGHKDLRMTLNVYYKQDAEAVAAKL